MSLINLASKTNNDIIDQQPFNFKNHFPQPIVIKPNSQVCLTHFYHFRDDGYYRITSQNNIIAYMIANFRNNSEYRYASLNTGRFTGAELALEIARAMNDVILQENYLWACVFAQGNPNANPVENDKFTISYSHVATPANPKGGAWTEIKNSQSTASPIISNNDTNNNSSTIQNSSNTERATAILEKGILLHEGVFRTVGFGLTGSGNSFSEAMKPHEIDIGLIRNSFSSVVNSNPNNAFNHEQGDIHIKSEDLGGGDHQLVFSNLQQRQGSTSIDSPNGKTQIERRVITDNDLNGIFDENDLFGFEIYRLSATTQLGHDFVIRLLKSTDSGATYTAITDATGGNAEKDGRPIIYSETLNGVAFTSLIYTTRGIPDGAGGRINNPSNGKSTATTNRGIVKYAPFKPFVSLKADQKQITGIELEDEKAILQTEAEESGNTTGGQDVVAVNVYTMEFKPYTGANGYDWRWIVETAETTPYTGIGSNDIHAFKFKQPTDNVYTLNVYADGNTPIGSATPIGTLTYNPYDGNGVGAFALSVSTLPIDPLGFKGDVEPALPTTRDLIVSCDGKFNGVGNAPTIYTGEKFNPLNHGNSNHDETLHGETLSGTENGVALGADLEMGSQLLLGRLTQSDIDDNSANPPRLDTDTAGGSCGATLGFGENVLVNDDTTLTFESDIAPIKVAGDDTLHISIPELPNVKSQEGETSNIGKTIKVVPKSVFSESDDTGALSYNAPYEDWIDINNGEELEINELTLQIRKPDMTLATSLQPTTRATIKIREDPSKVQARQNNDMANKIAQIMTQKQNTDTNLNVSYTGS